MSDVEFKKSLWLSSVPLVKLDGNNMPEGIASGALLDYGGKRILLTVSHATGDQMRWAITIRYVPGKGTENFVVGAMNFLAKASISNPKKKPQPVDFSYVEVPPGLCAYRQEIEPVSNAVKSETPITIHASTLSDAPDPKDTFGFCGMVKPSLENHFGQNYLGYEPQVCSGLSFLRSEGDYHYFLLPFDHPGHEYFKGCSGAPILSNNGALVALVCGGEIDTNEVRGLALNKYKTLIDILVGNIR